MSGDLADFLASAGAAVGGSTALGAAVGFAIGSVVRDLGISSVAPLKWAERWAGYGGVAGLAALAYRQLGVH